ncbi:MAG TPA: hypothetical protein ENJ87_12235 [Gammaproteobacteria bacterium]|nr:hypothetical protein [Gammaproteobacteria bacterium]
MKSIFLASSIILLLSFDMPLHAAPATISKQEAVNIAIRAYPGRVLAVKRKAGIYRVKTLNDNGKLHVIIIDANTGRIRSGNRSSK